MMTITIKDIVSENHDTRTYIFEPPENTNFVYKAGQFITLIINRNGREIRRSYSLSSSPGYDDYYAFTVKLVTNGEVSRYIFQTLRPGSELTALEPAGRFGPPQQPEPDCDIYLFAAGSGITPVFSLLKYFLKSFPSAAIKLIVQNRTENDLIFSDTIKMLGAQYQHRLKIFYFFSNPSKGHVPGRINNEQLENIVQAESILRNRRSIFYICGPLLFMRMVQFTLKSIGIENDNIKREIFDVPLPPKPSDNIDSSTKSITLIHQNQEFHFDMKYPQTILDAAILQKIMLPYSCRAGICGTCVIKCDNGSVQMKHNEVLTDNEVKNGLILSCVSYALTDLSLSTSL